jgi:hypothetical protein
MGITNYISKLIDQCDKSLELTQQSLNEYHLERISQMDLDSLELYDCINLHGKLGFLKNMVGLTELSLPFGSLIDKDLIYLEPLRNLTHLDLHQNSITGEGFSGMRFNNVSHLCMMGTNINMGGLKAIVNCFPNLTDFTYYARDNKFDEKCLEYLCSNVKGLVEVDFKELNVTDYSALAKCPALRSVYVSYSYKIGNYQSCKNIIPEIDNEYRSIIFPVLPNIKSLSVSIHLAEQVMKNIDLYTSLESLGISCINNTIVNQNICSLKNLESLCIHAYLENSDLAFLTKMPQLRELDLRFNSNLDDDALIYFKNLSNLNKLNVYKTKMTQVDAFMKYFHIGCNVYPVPEIYNEIDNEIAQIANIKL